MVFMAKRENEGVPYIYTGDLRGEKVAKK